jgi:hypothetical protein
MVIACAAIAVVWWVILVHVAMQNIPTHSRDEFTRKDEDKLN